MCLAQSKSRILSIFFLISISDLYSKQAICDCEIYETGTTVQNGNQLIFNTGQNRSYFFLLMFYFRRQFIRGKEKKMSINCHELDARRSSLAHRAFPFNQLKLSKISIRLFFLFAKLFHNKYNHLFRQLNSDVHNKTIEQLARQAVIIENDIRFGNNFM